MLIYTPALLSHLVLLRETSGGIQMTLVEPPGCQVIRDILDIPVSLVILGKVVLIYTPVQWNHPEQPRATSGGIPMILAGLLECQDIPGIVELAYLDIVVLESLDTAESQGIVAIQDYLGIADIQENLDIVGLVYQGIQAIVGLDYLDTVVLETQDIPAIVALDCLVIQESLDTLVIQVLVLADTLAIVAVGNQDTAVQVCLDIVGIQENQAIAAILVYLDIVG